MGSSPGRRDSPDPAALTGHTRARVLLRAAGKGGSSLLPAAWGPGQTDGSRNNLAGFIKNPNRSVLSSSFSERAVAGRGSEPGHFCTKRLVWCRIFVFFLFFLPAYQTATKSMKTNGAKKHLLINSSGYGCVCSGHGHEEGSQPFGTAASLLPAATSPLAPP